MRQVAIVRNASVLGMLFAIQLVILPNRQLASAAEDGADITRTFSAQQMSSEQLSDVLNLEWSVAEKGTRFSLDEIVATDDRSEVIFKISREYFRGAPDDPFVFKRDQNYMYFKIPTGAIFINSYSNRLYKSADAYAVIEKTSGYPLISRSHEAISALIQNDRWKGVVMEVSRPAP